MTEKNKITEFAREKFLQSGFYKISMDEIAKGLSISKKTIYKHFPSKNKLVDEVISDFRLGLKSKIEEIVDGKQNSILKIKMLTKIFAQFSLKLNQKFLFDMKTHRPDLWEEIEIFRKYQIENNWKRIINQGKAENYIIDQPSDIITSVIFSSVTSIVNPTFLLNHNYSISQAFQITFEIVIKGILTSKGLKVYNKIEQENENEKY